MKKLFSFVIILLVVVTSCKDNDVNIFDKTADERAAEAIAGLKKDLTAPANGWKVKYSPVDGSGYFWILMKFNEDNTVNIKTDLNADDGAYYDQTITYRIDNSLGLELVMESYSFFSFLFEQMDASYPAEFEFIYVNKTPENQLVFKSKTDVGVPTILMFEEATTGDNNLVGTTVAENLGTMAEDISRFSSAYKLTYTNKDIILYLSLDNFRRTLTITAASKKSNINTTKSIDFTTPFVIQGESILFDDELAGSFVGVNIAISSINLDDLVTSSLDACGSPIATHAYNGITSASDAVVLEPSFVDAGGKSFAANQFFSGPIAYIFNNGESAGEQVAMDIAGANQLQMYYNAGGLYGLGFFIMNPDGSRTFALREFTPTLNANNIVFNFEPDITIFESPTDANVDNINIYLDHLTQGNQTYIYKYAEGIYELYNPCSGWSAIIYAQ